MRNFKPFIVLIIFAFLFYFYFTLSFKPASQTPSSVPLPPLKFACSAWPGFLPVVLASKKGYFKEAGVDVEYFYSENIRQQLIDFGNGAYDGAGFALGTVISLYSKHPEVSVIAASDYSMGADALVANPPIGSVYDLKGKTILLNLGSYAEIFFDLTLQKHSMTRNDVNIRTWNDENTAVKELINKKADAAFIWEPYVTLALNKGAKTIYSSRDIPGIVTDVVVFQNKTLKRRPVDVKKFMDCWFKAVDYWTANTLEASLIISTAISADTERTSLKGIELCSKTANEKAFKENFTDLTSLYGSGKLYIDHYIKLGICRDEISISDLLNPAFIK